VQTPGGKHVTFVGGGLTNVCRWEARVRGDIGTNEEKEQVGSVCMAKAGELDRSMHL
jgi:hypothetical protein